MIVMFTPNTVIKRLNSKTPCYVGSVAMIANELYVESIAQLTHLTIIPSHFV